MSEYTTSDFHETLFNSTIKRQIVPEDVRRVVAAWGHSPEGYGSWEGGFLLELIDGRTAYITGWCDTTGWGCQDGATVVYFDSPPDRAQFKRNEYTDELAGPWDDDPADLNRYVQGGYQDTNRWDRVV